MKKGPDNLEKGIRFGCGGVVGLILGLYVSIRLFYDLRLEAVGISLLCFLVAGYFALKKGDLFYDIFKRWF